MFGLFIFKDTPSGTLCDAVVQLTSKLNQATDDFYAQEIGSLIGLFFRNVIVSMFIGLAAGLITTLFFKHGRFLVRQAGISQTALTLFTGYVAYLFSEWGSFSGVISMLFCGIILSHFNFYNMTPEGRSSAKYL